MLEPIRMRQNYPRSAKDVIPILLGRLVGDQPWAEQWLDTHPLGDSPTPGGSTLPECLAQDPNRLDRASAMIFGHQLPPLVKVLLATSPLSLQAHPTRQQARDGRARELLMGTPPGTPERFFKDDWPKPEIIVTLTPLGAFVGFHDPLLTIQLFKALEVGDALASVTGPLRGRTGSSTLQEVFLDVLSLDSRHHPADEILDAAVNHLDAPDELGVFACTIMEIDEYFPSDPGVLVALLLNRFSPEPGQALTLPPGVMHSRLCGICIEVMASSDDVLRGGLTSKYIDVGALLHVAGFTPGPGNVLLPSGSDGAYIYPTDFERFELWLLQPTDRDTLQVPRGDSGRIYLVVPGLFELTGDGDPAVLKPECAVFVAAEEVVVARGEGQLLAAVTGV